MAWMMNVHAEPAAGSPVSTDSSLSRRLPSSVRSRLSAAGVSMIHGERRAASRTARIWRRSVLLRLGVHVC